jgi:hypothetical protein
VVAAIEMHVVVTYGRVLLSRVKATVNGAREGVGGCGFVQAEDEVGPRAGMRWHLPQLSIK